MGGKKIQHHTSKSLANKVKAATENKGGGKAGKADRMGGAAGHSRYSCSICAVTCSGMPTMKAHFESKHPKTPFHESLVKDNHAGGVQTTTGVAVKGSNKRK